MTFEQATAILNTNPSRTIVAKINGRFYTLPTAIMKGFIISSDQIEYMKVWGE